MFELTFKKVILGTAVIGGMAVAGYYSYKWYTERESNPKEDGKFNEETLKSVKEAEFATQVKPTETDVADEPKKGGERATECLNAQCNVVAFDGNATALQTEVQTQICVEDIKSPTTSKVVEVLEDVEKTADEGEIVTEAQIEVQTQCVIKVEGTKDPKPESGTEVKSRDEVAAEAQTGVQTKLVLELEGAKDAKQAKRGEAAEEVQIVQDGGKPTAGKAAHEKSGMTEGLQAEDELGAFEGTITEGKIEGIDAAGNEIKDDVERMANLVLGEWGSRIRNEIYLPPILQNIHTMRELDQTMEALCAFLFKLPRTDEELREVQLELGWVFDLAFLYLNRVPEKVPVLREDTESVTYAYDGTPMEKID